MCLRNVMFFVVLVLFLVSQTKKSGASSKRPTTQRPDMEDEAQGGDGEELALPDPIEKELSQMFTNKVRFVFCAELEDEHQDHAMHIT
jgi:hypothetical protein